MPPPLSGELGRPAPFEGGSVREDANEQTDAGHPGVRPAPSAALEPGAEFSQGLVADAELAGV